MIWICKLKKTLTDLANFADFKICIICKICEKNKKTFRNPLKVFFVEKIISKIVQIDIQLKEIPYFRSDLNRF